MGSKPVIICPHCNEEKESYLKGLCYSCYRKQWKPPMIKCKSCGRIRPHKAFGLCNGCHMRVCHYDKVKRYNAKKNYNISLEKMREITRICASCGFDKFVTLHHINGDKMDSSDENLVGLCLNCHKMIPSYQYFEEIKAILAKKGYRTEKIHPSNYVNKRDIEAKYSESSQNLMKKFL